MPNYNCVCHFELYMQYTIAMVGYGDDQYTTTVLELKYSYGVTEYTKGNAYSQVCLFIQKQNIPQISVLLRISIHSSLLIQSFLF